jgi:50S ribosomal protein L16 3-hydroxylase
MAASRPPLGGLSPQAFLRQFWQKRPLLVRQAIPRFAGVLDKRALFALASSEDAEARLIERRPAWRVTSGPLDRRTLSRLPSRDWTLLVNGVNLHSHAADSLLRQFAFLSWARLDDVMVSHAADGGGVGPHADSYDVFLLQGAGRRRWRLMPPGKQPFKLVEGAPLKLIKGFRASEEMILDPGDMLYVPPGWGHDGTAIGPCETYSIGFRAPRGTELSTAFLDFLHERGFSETVYRDPGRKPAVQAARIDASLIEHATRSLAKIRWTRADVASFAGRYLSEPKQDVLFSAPRPALGRAAFMRKLGVDTVCLDPRSRMLTQGTRVYLNGAEYQPAARIFKALQQLADARELPGGRLAHAGAADLIFDWYRQGFLGLDRKPRTP